MKILQPAIAMLVITMSAVESLAELLTRSRFEEVIDLDRATALDGQPGGDRRRSVGVESLDYIPDGTIKPITQTVEVVRMPPKK
jgi:hypothetical protein